MADVNNSKVEDTDQPKAIKGKVNPLVIILLLFILLLLGSLVYLFFTDKVMIVGLENPVVGDVQKQDNVSIEDEENTNVEESEDKSEDVVSMDGVTEDQEETTGGNVYTNTTIGISLEYPEGWEISEESLNYIKNLHNHEIKDMSLKLTIESEDRSATFNYKVPFGYGHEFCVFEDSLELIEGTLQKEYGEYMEYERGEYIYRIADIVAFEKPVCKCKRREGGVNCINWMSPGYVSFGLEDNVQESKINELLDILESIEYTGDIYKAANEASSII